MEMAIGCGVESMSRVPMGSDGALTEEFRADFPCQLLHQGISAEMIAEKWGVTREELDEFAAQSHCRAAAAQRNDWTRAELFSLSGLEADEGVRANPDLSRMRALKPVFKVDGVVTAANSSQISDGAGAVLLASGEKADELGLRKRARIVARAVVGSDPELMLTGPIPATLKALGMADRAWASIGWDGRGVDDQARKYSGADGWALRVAIDVHRVRDGDGDSD
jgi:acetyl-CoA acyltransferase